MTETPVPRDLPPLIHQHTTTADTPEPEEPEEPVVDEPPC